MQPEFNKKISSVPVSGDNETTAETLLRSERMYRSIFNEAPIGISNVDSEGRMVNVNNTFAEMLGYTREEMMSRLMFDITHPDDRDANRLHLDDLVSGRKKNIKIQKRYLKKSGETIQAHVRGTAVYDDDGKFLYTISMIEDITERLRNEAALRESEEKYRELTDSLPQIIFETDGSGKLVYVNKLGADFMGYPIGYLETKPDVLSFVHPDDRNATAEKLQMILNGAEGRGREIRMLHRDGKILDCMIYSSPVRKSNRIIGLRGIIVDVSEHKRMEDDLKVAKERAEEMNKLKSIFLANMSHELRTPMIGILGYAMMISEDIKDPQIKQMAGTIVKSANRLTDTLNLILDLSKIEANRIDLRLHNVDPAHLLEEVVNHYRPAAEEKGLKLNFHAVAGGMTSRLDERLFSRIAGNLIHNAVKYTREGQVDVELTAENDMAVVRVKDTGIGISEKNFGLIFEPFRQVSEGYNRRFEGTGLGLTISRKFIELMNGTIEVESEVNKGSVFTVRFPYLKIQGDDKVIQTEQTGEGELKKRVKKRNSQLLLVEDDRINVDVINLFLRDYCNVDHSSSALEAIEMVKARKYDAILMDINLKGMTGLDAVKIIREMDEYRETPVIAVTAYAMAGDRKRFLSQGCSHYLAKPFSKKELIDLLEIVLN